MNALMLLKTDHKTVETLFKEFEKLGEGGAQKKKAIVAKIVKELSVHASIEEQIFYPACRKALKDEDMILEALEEHHIVKWVLSELEGMEPSAERFDAKVTVLMENVRHHVKEEEQDLFPQVRKKMEAKQLKELGLAMEKAKKLVPTRPHPKAPDTPPGNIIAGLGAGMLDKAKDAGKRMVETVTGRNGSAKRGRANGAGSARASH